MLPRRHCFCGQEHLLLPVLEPIPMRSGEGCLQTRARSLHQLCHRMVLSGYGPGATTPLYPYTQHSGSIRCVAWSETSDRIASASNDGTVQVWTALTRSEERRVGK